MAEHLSSNHVSVGQRVSCQVPVWGHNQTIDLRDKVCVAKQQCLL
jgi:hypothetical protein